MKLSRRRAGPGQVCDVENPPSVHDEAFGARLEAFTSAVLRDGHRVERLRNGDETFPRLWEDLREAEHSITVQMYYVRPGRVTDTLREILVERARAGVRVMVLVDAIGARGLPDEYLADLQAAGIEAEWFRPVRWWRFWTGNHRSHVRGVVVDGKVGYTGGFGFADQWLGSGCDAGEWRDTNVRFTGPAVRQLQGTFSSAWSEATGRLLAGDIFFPVPATEGAGVSAAFLHTAPTIGSTEAERFIAYSFAATRESLYIASGYFAPDDPLVAQLGDAAGRGVDVRVLTESSRTDVPLARWAGRSRYGELLRAGVRIYEYQPAMMHAKMFVADGRWCTVGAMNLDHRSMQLNDEANLLIRDEELGARLQSDFRDDLEHAREIRLEDFESRPWSERVREQGAELLLHLI